MPTLLAPTAFTLRLLFTLRAVIQTRVTGGSDRGDVPGWVMVTIMTAGLVTALWFVAEDRLSTIFTDALDDVVGGP